MALLGMGTAGLMFLSFRAHQMRMQALKYPTGQQMHLMNPVVQDRIRKTLMYFGGGLAATGVITAAMRNSMFALNHPFLLMFGSLGFLLGTMFTDYHKSPMLKHLMWGGFMGMTGLGMVPLI